MTLQASASQYSLELSCQASFCFGGILCFELSSVESVCLLSSDEKLRINLNSSSPKSNKNLKMSLIQVRSDKGNI